MCFVLFFLSLIGSLNILLAETLYENQTEYKNEGVYKYSSTIGIDFPNATLTEQQKTEYQKEFQKQVILINMS